MSTLSLLLICRLRYHQMQDRGCSPMSPSGMDDNEQEGLLGSGERALEPFQSLLLAIHHPRRLVLLQVVRNFQRWRCPVIYQRLSWYFATNKSCQKRLQNELWKRVFHLGWFVLMHSSVWAQMPQITDAFWWQAIASMQWHCRGCMWHDIVCLCKPAP